MLTVLTTVFIPSPSWTLLARKASWRIIQCIRTASPLLSCTLAHTMKAIPLCSPVITGKLVPFKSHLVNYIWHSFKYIFTRLCVVQIKQLLHTAKIINNSPQNKLTAAWCLWHLCSHHMQSSKNQKHKHYLSAELPFPWLCSFCKGVRHVDFWVRT